MNGIAVSILLLLSILNVSQARVNPNHYTPPEYVVVGYLIYNFSYDKQFNECFGMWEMKQYTVKCEKYLVEAKEFINGIHLDVEKYLPLMIANYKRFLINIPNKCTNFWAPLSEQQKKQLYELKCDEIRRGLGDKISEESIR